MTVLQVHFWFSVFAISRYYTRNMTTLLVGHRPAYDMNRQCTVCLFFFSPSLSGVCFSSQKYTSLLLSSKIYPCCYKVLQRKFFQGLCDELFWSFQNTTNMTEVNLIKWFSAGFILNSSIISWWTQSHQTENKKISRKFHEAYGSGVE